MTPPMIWPLGDQASGLPPFISTADVSLTEDQCLELHKVLSLEKFIPYSKACFRMLFLSPRLLTVCVGRLRM